jgi:hypothetical protein
MKLPARLRALRSVGAVASVALLSTVPAIAAPVQVGTASGLSVAAETHDMVWNAVARDGNRTFVSGPRWAGGRGPALARLVGSNHLSAYPDAAWNAWHAGADASHAFVNVNAIHPDGHGGLWVIDTGSPTFGGAPLPGAAKAVRIDLRTNRVTRIYPFDATVALPGSYVDDIRFHGNHAYLTDAGRAGLIVLDLDTGSARRVLDGHPSVTAPSDRPIELDGQVVRTPDGAPLKVNSDPLEVSVDGQYLLYASLQGPWSRVGTQWLDDPTLSAADLASHVEPWADLPPVGGTTMGPDGTLYFTELATNSLKSRAPDGTISTLVQDARLHWVDAPTIADGALWLPVPQIDRVALFQGGTSRVQWPVQLFRLTLVPR